MATCSNPANRARADYYRRIAGDHLAPLWEVLGTLVPAVPNTPCVPALWTYEKLRPLLLEAGGLISAREAERRVLVLENPGLVGGSAITRSMYAGLQLVLPGEVAPSHRHTQSALRFVVEGSGAYTAVDGERIPMQPGDLIITPAWTFHEHGNPGDSPVVWLDGLDIPLVSFFDAGFAERYGGDSQPMLKPENDTLLRYGNNLLPIDDEAPSAASPLLHYPYRAIRKTLDRLSRNGPLDACHGLKMRYANPATGGYPIPTIAAFIQLLPKGFRGQCYRVTDGSVYSVVEGRGVSHVGEQRLAWGPRDVFVAPSWCPVSHEAEEDAVLFSYSDRPAQKALGLWRQERAT